MKTFSVQLNYDKESKIFIKVECNVMTDAPHYLQSNKWVKDEDTEIYYNMDKVLSFRIYDKNDM
ncbi:hypothetical protein [Cytobacillus oceanisediminis]|uniref:hypothetical protein n=1 Tax=Cytobacillus oceanisediminis TaxID=665099 RepID=UPI0020794F4B|nr:hypothetical protein [Cytobacillus oceanisediminis]MBY0157285.1 hypothetical protein [Cytobacillus firmus]USK46264.1 hypothetical protein LIT27_10585 [Cytobacillus oceanisediminis]